MKSWRTISYPAQADNNEEIVNMNPEERCRF